MPFLKFKATQLFTGTEMLDNSKVLITDEKGIVQDIADESETGEDVQSFEGILSPGFINSHCHLELSHLKDKIPEKTGMVDFILHVLQKRFAPPEKIEEAIANAEAEMLQNGIVAVGDICNTAHTIQQKQKGNLYYHNFIEASGFVPATAQQRFNQVKEVFNQFEEHFPNQTSLVPHAPYSVSNELFELIGEVSRNKIISMHNQESAEENEFFQTASGNFLKLYKNLGIDIAFFRPARQNSLTSVAHHLFKACKAILVHNTFADVEELTELNRVKPTQFYVCLCVLANRYITNSQPAVEIFNNNSNRIVIGTDSLASNRSLNVLTEIQSMKHHYPHLSHVDLLRFATLNGALALGIEDKYGSFKRGKQPGIILIENFNISKQPVLLVQNH